MSIFDLDVFFPDNQEKNPFLKYLSTRRDLRIFLFSGLKFTMDRAFALAVMPFTAIVAVFLLCLNPFFNPGPLLYAQIRMGKGRRAFVLYKFRTMTQSNVQRAAKEGGFEKSRITPLGAFLRKHRIDELPNMFSVLKGDMSVIGPRPETWSLAKHYCRNVPIYARRFAVRPGITGLAQVESGYADGMSATMRKAEIDAKYIRNYGFRQEARIVRKTFRVIFTGDGAQ